MTVSPSESPHPASFRDPAGRVFRRDGQLLRQVNVVYREEYDALLRSGLLHDLIKRDMLIPHAEVDALPLAGTKAHRVLKPEPIPFVSYPFEWSFSQLKDAALLTLATQKIALDYGMTLKDASAYNVQFRAGRPIIIDTLSFERYREGEPWGAYRQFCEHFLTPLSLISEVDARVGQLLRVHIDGIPVDLASKLLPKVTWLRPGIAMHIHLHARAERSATTSHPMRSTSRRFNAASLRAIADHLQATIEGLRWDPTRSPWSDYATTADHYSGEARKAKHAAVNEFLDTACPATLWDLGANTGEYSRLASERGIRVLALDSDAGAVDTNYRLSRDRGDTNILPLVVDLANPSPGLGWMGEERGPLLARGHADAALILGLIHHLAVGNNLPFAMVAKLVASVAEWALVEFVPKEDPKAAAMLAHRRDVFSDYTEDGFLEGFGSQFTLVRSIALENSSRALYTFRRRDAVT